MSYTIRIGPARFAQNEVAFKCKAIVIAIEKMALRLIRSVFDPKFIQRYLHSSDEIGIRNIGY